MWFERLILGGEEYRLKLANGMQWHFGATRNASTWLTNFAEILELSPWVPSDGGSRILVTRDYPEVTREFAEQGWSSYQRYGMTFLSNELNNDLIYIIRSEDSPDDNICNMWSCVQPLYRQALKNGGIALHAALAEWEGVGVLFAAPGGGGKSTTLSRLPDYWNALGDDEMIMVPNLQGGYNAHPFPTWSRFLLKHTARTWNVEQSVPVGAIFFLKQADQDVIVPLDPGLASAYINQSARQIMSRGWSLLGNEKESALKIDVIDVSVKIAMTIPTSMLYLSLNGRFWDKIEALLGKLRKPVYTQ